MWKAYYKFKKNEQDQKKFKEKTPTIKGSLAMFIKVAPILLALFKGWKVRRVLDSIKIKDITMEYSENYKLKKQLFKEVKDSKYLLF
jgi:hypothetical protein